MRFYLIIRVRRTPLYTLLYKKIVNYSAVTRDLRNFARVMSITGIVRKVFESRQRELEISEYNV